jgi:hypothetical protein
VRKLAILACAVVAAALLTVDISAQSGPAVAALSQPVLAKRVNLSPLSGRVSVRTPGQRTYARLRSPRQVPVRTRIDARQGQVRVVSARNRQGDTQPARISQGIFEVRQSSSGLTTLYMRGGATPEECEAEVRSSRSARRLRFRGRGNYRTRSSGVAGTVRGTTFKVTDDCGTVTTEVSVGEVLVQNFIAGTRARLFCATVRTEGGERRRACTRGRFRTRGRYSAATVRGG